MKYKKPTNSVLLYLFIFSMCIAGCQTESAEAVTPNNQSLYGYYDGPYIIYKGDSATVILRVNRTTEGAITEQKTLSIEELHAQKLKVYPDARNEQMQALKPFEVQIQNWETEKQWAFPQPANVFALSDIECSFTNTESILRTAGVIDDNYNWTYGEGHLVVNGDIFSRGLDMMALLWLLYKLDYEAMNAGGKVHVLLGNHEAMNLRGDVRYVEQRYIDFAETIGISYAELFGVNSEIGRWLRTKNSVITIGNNLFVHAGISREFINLGITPLQANELVREGMGKPRSELEGEIQNFLFRTNGPQWYRGMVRNEPDYNPINREDLNKILEYFQVSKIIVGHTKGDKIRSLWDGDVIVIDVNHSNNRKSDTHRGLWINKNAQGKIFYYKLNDSGDTQML